MSISPTPKFSLLTLACASVLALAGCGSSSDSQSAPPAATSTSASTSANTSASARSTSTPKASATASASATPSKAPTTEAPTATATTDPPQGTVTTVPATEEKQPSAPVASSAPVATGVPSGPAVAEPAQTATCDYGQVHLSADVAPGGGAAGSRYLNLTFTNTGDSACSLSGYPSVNYVDGEGNQIGAGARQAAEWTSSPKVIQPGESAHATLRETRASLYGATCQPTQSAGYRVSIPGTSSSLILNFPAEACSSSSISQLSVGQVGANVG
ncbi:MAG: DUF4232 domain-containing protein [Rothia sp. (in: high G+C Gram-positive bacteria)]|nr:DUF4232 domain-containing protein [Rothia sp. (in: high G+C Gram-positive bacteria)]